MIFFSQRAGKVSTNRPPGIFLVPPEAARLPGRAERRRDQIARVTYWAEAGVASTAVGAWASVAFSGHGRILVWMGITTALAAIAILFARPAISFLSHCYRMGRGGGRPGGS